MANQIDDMTEQFYFGMDVVFHGFVRSSFLLCAASRFLGAFSLSLVICVLTFRRGIVGVLAPYLTGRRAAEPLPEPPATLEGHGQALAEPAGELR